MTLPSAIHENEFKPEQPAQREGAETSTSFAISVIINILKRIAEGADLILEKEKKAHPGSQNRVVELVSKACHAGEDAFQLGATGQRDEIALGAVSSLVKGLEESKAASKLLSLFSNARVRFAISLILGGVLRMSLEGFSLLETSAVDNAKDKETKSLAEKTSTGVKTELEKMIDECKSVEDKAKGEIFSSQS